MPNSEKLAVLRLGSLGDIRCLRAFLALHDFELDLITLLQTLVTFRRDGAVMNEHIGPIFAPDKSVSFRVVKPLDGAFQTFHVRTPQTCGFQYGACPLDAILLPSQGHVKGWKHSERPIFPLCAFEYFAQARELPKWFLHRGLSGSSPYALLAKGG